MSFSVVPKYGEAPAADPTSDTGPSAQDAIAYIVGAEGDLDLAAERLFGVTSPANPYPRAQLITLVAEDPNSAELLASKLRTLTILQAFNSVRLVGATVDGSLDRLTASDRSKLYTSLLSIISGLTDEHSTNINANINSNSTSLSLTEHVMSKLPPNIQEAMKVLMLPSSGGQPTNGVVHDVEVQDTHSGLGNSPPNAAVEDSDVS